MSQGRTTEISKDQIAIITGDDWHFEQKLINRIKRYGFKKIYEKIRGKE